jgi:hypothetical protein
MSLKNTGGKHDDIEIDEDELDAVISNLNKIK